MKNRSTRILLNCFLFAAAQTLCAACRAQTSEPAAPQSSVPAPNTTDSQQAAPDKPQKQESPDPNSEDSNALGVSLLKNLVSDQKAIWTSPAHVRWADGIWLFPLAAATGGFFASDRSVPPALTTDQNKLNHYVSISNYSLYSMIGAGGGMYIWGRLSHDDHRRETGVLAGEAAIDALAVDTGLKYAF